VAALSLMPPRVAESLDLLAEICFRQRPQRGK
jgi:hypothetical protein